jgi:hypothetical protein
MDNLMDKIETACPNEPEDADIDIVTGARVLAAAIVKLTKPGADFIVSMPDGKYLIVHDPDTKKVRIERLNLNG